MSSNTANEPSKVNGQYNSIVGGLKEVVGDATGYTGLSKSGNDQKAQGDAEQTAAKAKGYVDGTADRVGGKIDHVMGAVTGDTAREASGKAQHQKGVAEQKANE